MTRRTNTNQALAAMRAANPARTAELAEKIDEGELATAMQRAIASGEQQDVPTAATLPRRLSVARLGLAAGIACAVVVGLIVLVGGTPGGTGRPAFAAAAVEVAEANPRLLVGEPGWEVTRADQFERNEGEVSFSNGVHRLDVHWYPARLYRSYRRDRSLVSAPQRSTLFGRPAVTVDYGRGEYATMLAPQGAVFVELRGAVGGRAAYERLIGSLRSVDVGTWLGAMPPSAVRPDERAAAIEQVLRGVPLPPGFDVDALAESGAVRDRYQLVAEATGAVACGWVESWLEARRAGDREAVTKAVDAMATWSRWPALRGEQMRRGWAANIEQAANRIARGKLNHGPAGIVRQADGSSFEYGPQWSLALDCEASYRRPVEP